METFYSVIAFLGSCVVGYHFGLETGILTLLVGIFLQIRMKRRDSMNREILDLLRQINIRS